jgi:hypothetical protein
MNQTEPSQVIVNTTEYTMNPNWNSVRLTGDLAIIKFSPITFTRNSKFKLVELNSKLNFNSLN